MTGDGPSSAAMRKESMRLEIASRLAGLPTDRGAAASTAICDALVGILNEGDLAEGAVLSFAPIRRSGAVEEVDLSALNHELIRAGRLALARIDWENRAMRALRLPAAPVLDEAQMLEVRRHGVPEPALGTPARPRTLRAVLVPGLAFDRGGARLGRGGGFYDRFLEGVGRPAGPILIGVCFEAQLVERVPVEAHDYRVDRLVTEASRLVCER